MCVESGLDASREFADVEEHTGSLWDESIGLLVIGLVIDLHFLKTMATFIEDAPATSLIKGITSIIIGVYDTSRAFLL